MYPTEHAKNNVKTPSRGQRKVEEKTDSLRLEHLEIASFLGDVCSWSRIVKEEGEREKARRPSARGII